MLAPKKWTPFYWRAGPLADAMAGKTAPTTAWLRPEQLALLDGTPFNCIVVPWSAGRPEDAAQQTALKPLLERARARDIAVVGRIVKPGQALSFEGLAAVIAEDPVHSPIPVFPAGSVSKASRIPGAVAAVTKALWPGIPGRSRGGGEESAQAATASGPTGNPWINSNGWMASLVRARNSKQSTWILSEPPTNTAVRDQAYELAVADAGAWNAKWVVSLDGNLQNQIGEGDAAALKKFRRLADAVAFFDRQPAGSLLANFAVLSSFSGPVEALSCEILNLSCRRHLPCQPLDLNQPDNELLKTFRGTIAFVEAGPPEGKMAERLRRFVESGGLLILPSAARDFAAREAFKGTPQKSGSFDVYTSGKGRLAIAEKEWIDPYEVTSDLALLHSRRNDLIRLWNASFTNTVYSNVSPRRDILQILNYTGRVFGEPMSAGTLHRRYRSAIWTGLDDTAGVKLKLIPRDNGGMEMELPPFPIYGSIQLDI